MARVEVRVLSGRKQAELDLYQPGDEGAGAKSRLILAIHMTTVSPDLLRRFDIPGPRYTSYPTADRFVEAFGAADWRAGLAQRRAGPAALARRCRCTCTFRSASRSATTAPATRSSREARARRRLPARLAREVDLHTAQTRARPAGDPAAPGRRHAHVPVGRGTAQLMAMLRRSFALAPGGEYSIEVDPRTVERERLQALADWASTASASACRISIPRCRRRCTASSRPSRCSR